MKGMIMSVSAAVTFGIVSTAAASPATKVATGDKFYVYEDAASVHWIPSGYMGDYGDVHINQRWDKNPASGKSCMQVKYSAERKQGAGWAGVYWQTPANNWGNFKGGWDLTGYKTLKFKARGETGKEWLDKFMVGGITGQEEPGDTDGGDTGQLQLGKEWKEYSINLSAMDLSHIIGGFGFVVNSDSAPNGETFYIDDVRFEK